MYEKQAKIKHGLKVRTCFVSAGNLEALVKAEWLPVFIIRSIHTNPLIARWAGTPVHMYWLAPKSDLFHSYRDGRLDWDDYADIYADDILSSNRLESLIEKLEILRSTAGAKGIVLMGYGSDPERCHRGVLAKIINQADILIEPIKELVI